MADVKQEEPVFFIPSQEQQPQPRPSETVVEAESCPACAVGFALEPRDHVLESARRGFHLLLRNLPLHLISCASHAVPNQMSPSPRPARYPAQPQEPGQAVTSALAALQRWSAAWVLLSLGLRRCRPSSAGEVAQSWAPSHAAWPAEVLLALTQLSRGCRCPCVVCWEAGGLGRGGAELGEQGGETEPTDPGSERRLSLSC